MATQPIKLICPRDGAMISVPDQPGIEKMSIICPVCSTRQPFSAYKRVGATDAETQLPGKDPHSSSSSPSSSQESVGELIDQHSGRVYSLVAGRNVVGRKGNGSEATIQIPCSTKAMSRAHLTIEVKKGAGNSHTFYASLFKEKVNDTFINNMKLEAGDRVILRPHDIIKLPEITLRFEIPDADATDV